LWCYSITKTSAHCKSWYISIFHPNPCWSHWRTVVVKVGLNSPTSHFYPSLLQRVIWFVIVWKWHSLILFLWLFTCIIPAFEVYLQTIALESPIFAVISVFPTTKTRTQVEPLKVQSISYCSLSNRFVILNAFVRHSLYFRIEVQELSVNEIYSIQFMFNYY
jgi:hypothetical protein